MSQRDVHLTELFFYKLFFYGIEVRAEHLIIIIIIPDISLALNEFTQSGLTDSVTDRLSH